MIFSHEYLKHAQALPLRPSNFVSRTPSSFGITMKADGTLIVLFQISHINTTYIVYTSRSSSDYDNHLLPATKTNVHNLHNTAVAIINIDFQL